jgi:2-polyprenyl-3-methyl-5-hydroxy-6-metoxy-1,4-benzoquinol methylase
MGVMTASCRACKSSRTRPHFRIADNQVIQCRDCSHVFLATPHTPTTIREMYQDYESEDRDFYFQGIQNGVIENMDRYLEQCRQYCLTGRDHLRLLDIGCGTGALLSRAVRKEFECEGIEICEALARTAQRQVGVPVHNDFLENLGWQNDTVDVVTMYDLIEHVPDPAKEIRLAHKALRPGGILFVLTPNDDALIRRIARTGYRWSLHTFQRPMKRLYYFHHLSYFTKTSLVKPASAAGFEIVRFETRNQELSRLSLSALEKLGTRLVFRMADQYPGMGGKLLLWARKT